MGSQADELLTAVTDSDAELGEAILGDMELGTNAYGEIIGNVDEPHIVIGKDRFITVPDQLKRLAVQFDHDVETVTFDCPRYWDEHDMSQMKVYINYVRSDRVIGSYIVKSPITINEVDDGIMHFDWTISREVSSASGHISFLVCIKKTDEVGEETTHWNSELCKDCYISEGLEAIPAVAAEYPDMITYMLTRLDLLDENVQQYVTDYLNSSTTLEDMIRSYINSKYVSDKTLTVNGGFADAKAVGDRIKALEDKIAAINAAVPYTIRINDTDQTIDFVDRTV